MHIDIMGNKLQMQIALIFMINVVYCFASAGCDGWSDKDIELVKRDGLQIIAAIERFESDHGNHPDRLDRLIPEYLPVIPKTPSGCLEQWEYWPMEREKRFELGVNKKNNRGGTMFYKSDTKEWIIDEP